jgi:methylmalonyl-CoA mutase
MNARQLKKRIKTIVQQEGRRPRILLAHLESEQSNRWTKPLAASLAELGFDVDIGPANQAPLQAARLAIDNDVHMVCVSLSDIANRPLVIQLAAALQAQNNADIRLIIGGVGSLSNKQELHLAGVDLIVNFDTAKTHLANQILDLLE